jgi:hypothetical protein
MRYPLTIGINTNNQEDKQNPDVNAVYCRRHNV